MRELDDKVLVSGQIHPDEIVEFRDQGVTLIINNRPDGEDPDQPLGVQIEEAAAAAGIDYRSVPIIRGIGPADADAMRDAIAASEGKVLAFCRSGTRSALAWALAKNDEGMEREEIERRLISAGVDPTPIAHLF